MINTFNCDMCKKDFGNDQLHEDYDGLQFCTKCDLKGEIGDLQRDIKHETEWLNNTHLKRLREDKKKLKELKKKLRKAIRDSKE